MIKPTVGRVVLFRPGLGFERIGTRHDDQPFAATVAYVWHDRLVNLAFADHDGRSHNATSVPLLQDDDKAPVAFYAEWMPYQKGQAAKTEQLEKLAADTRPPAAP
jgi:hypothetical protein